MPILFDRLQIIFFEVGKVASTSVKGLLGALNSGDPGFVALERDQIHVALAKHEITVRSALNDYPKYWKFGLVRDPIQRLRSAYDERVVRYDSLRTGRFARTRALLLNVKLSPTLAEFARDLPRYRLQSGSARRHTHPYRIHFGPNIDALDAVHGIEKIVDLEHHLSARLGSEIILPRKNVAPIKPPPISLEDAEAVIDRLMPEYEYLKGRYSVPSISDLTKAEETAGATSMKILTT